MDYLMIKPKDVPFPIGYGPATFKAHGQDTAFKGGIIPEDKYPLVSKAPLYPKTEKPTLMSPQDWHRIRDLLESNDESTARRKEEAGEEKQRNLKELSDSLKRSWGQTDKSRAQQIAERLADAKAAEEMRREDEVREVDQEKLEQRRRMIAEAKEAMKRWRHPYKELNKAMLLGEVEAVNESNIKLKTERKAREREAAKELETKVRVADEEFDSELTNREARLRARDMEIRKFQAGQVAERQRRLQEEREEAKTFREKAEANANYEYTERKMKQEHDRGTHRKFAASQARVGAVGREKAKMLEELDATELAAAADQRNEFERRKLEFEKKLRERTVRVGRRQLAAREWLSENVLPKEAEEMKRAELQRARKVREDHAAAERMEAERRAEEADMWREVQDYARSEEKRKSEMEMARSSAEKEEERLLGEIKLGEHLRREEDKDQEHLRKRGVMNNFWSKQVGVLNSERSAAKNSALKTLLEKQREEAAEDLEVDETAREMIADQTHRLRNTHALRHMKDRHRRERGAAVVAADASGIRINNGTRDPNYRPSQSRERLSLAWN